MNRSWLIEIKSAELVYLCWHCILLQRERSFHAPKTETIKFYSSLDNKSNTKKKRKRRELKV